MQDIAQAVVAAYRYDPFGVLLAKTGSLEQPFGFSTKRTDPKTGQVFYQRRVYVPEIGGWTTRDPLGEAGGLNLYAFVGNNPVNWIDPWGLAIRYPGIEYNAQAIAEFNGKLHGYLDFLPSWLLEMLFPVEPSSIITDSLTGLVCPLSVNSPYPEFTKEMLSKSKVIAKGRNIKKIDDLVRMFGGRAKNWIKKKGWDKFGKEWHWYEHPGIGRVGAKPKGTPDPF